MVTFLAMHQLAQSAYYSVTGIFLSLNNMHSELVGASLEMSLSLNIMHEDSEGYEN